MNPVDYRAFPILVVDDEPEILRTFAFNYRNDFTILTAGDTAAALARIRETDIALVLAGQRWAGRDGLLTEARAPPAPPAHPPAADMDARRVGEGGITATSPAWTAPAHPSSSKGSRPSPRPRQVCRGRLLEKPLRRDARRLCARRPRAGPSIWRGP
jgi:hypothetical protein